MITAVDTNVLLDVFLADKRFAAASADALRSCLREGALGVCDTEWAETATVFPEEEPFLATMRKLGIEYSPVNETAASSAARAWRSYRAAGGKRTRLVADFLVGAHAAVQCNRLLSRDRGFYRSYFSQLDLMDPSQAL